MNPIYLLAFIFGNMLNYSFINAQQDSSSCKVITKSLVGSYTGGCKNGLANGNGEANGVYRYKGAFKDGMPNGTGIYYYSENEYYEGNFQDGIKEGKGEMHYIRKSMPDSIVKGYWSGGEFKGNKYTTYSYSTTEIGTNSGSPNGTAAGFVLLLNNIVSPNGCILKTRSKYESSFKSYVTIELVSFPCKLFGTLTNSQTFELELYKAANWKVRLFKNQ